MSGWMGVKRVFEILETNHVEHKVLTGRLESFATQSDFHTETSQEFYIIRKFGGPV